MNVSLNENTIALKRGYWQSQMKAWEESGLKQEEYCVKSGIRYSTFVYWRGILLKENISALPELVGLVQTAANPRVWPNRAYP